MSDCYFILCVYMCVHVCSVSACACAGSCARAYPNTDDCYVCEYYLTKDKLLL